MKEHLIKEQENKWHCLYCNHELGDHNWISVWEGEFHYKEARCKCGKKQRVKVDFVGSGHDDWDKEVGLIFKDGKIDLEQKKKKSVEEKIREELSRLDHT